MTDADVAQLRKVMAINRSNKDPLIMVEIKHLRALLDVWEWYTAGERPRVRVKARKETA